MTVCTHCSSTKSPLWRRGMHAEILCNACGLYWKHHGTYRPLSLKAAADRKEPKKSPTLDLPAKRDTNLRKLKSTLEGSASSDARRKFGRGRTSAGKIAIPNLFLQTTAGRWRGEPIYAPELPPSAGSANIRLVPAEIRESSALNASVVRGLSLAGAAPDRHPPLAYERKQNVKYIMFRGRLLFVGDHVAVRGDDSQVYFAIVHDFWMVPSGQKYVHLQWLLPKARHALEIDGPPEKIDASFFILGPMHGRAELIESIVDVFLSPQSLRRPLEGPTPAALSLSQYSSRCITPESRRSRGTASEGGRSRDDLSLPSGASTPTADERRSRRVMSDSEVELNRADGLLSAPQCVVAAKPVASSGNILEDVEIAHLLCSMI